ncbi:MAG: zf-HC2 domain-containing protein [Lachnospiraceae bacterium]|nr:zf-HC2 domain-containing protein [Lachnospiraceae bacterium]
MDCTQAKAMVDAYIEGTLTDQECSEFLNHVKGCKECHDELETYFIVDYALQYLDEANSNRSYDMQKLLKDDIEENERRILITRMARMVTAAGIIASEVMLLLTTFIKLHPSLARAITHYISYLFPD